MFKHQFINFFDINDLTVKFEEQCNDMHLWIKGRLDLSGGWLETIEEAYFPKFAGCYMYDKESTCELEYIASNLGQLYYRIGTQVQEYYQKLNSEDFWKLFEFTKLSSQQQALINYIGLPHSWAPLIRPDMLVDAAGNFNIVEVNAGNVAGIEEIIMFLLYLRKVNSLVLHKETIDRTLDRILLMTKQWLVWQYQHYLVINQKQLNKSKISIAVVYEDRTDCFFTSKYLALIFKHLGFDAVHCRAEHLSIKEGLLYAETPLGLDSTVVNVVYADFIFDEMFTDCDYKEPEILPQFQVILEAVKMKIVLLLNPLTEVLITSKTILAELWKGDGSIFNLTKSEQDFIYKYIPRTIPLGDVKSGEIKEYIIKPSHLHGGRGVLISADEVQKFHKKRNLNKDKNYWVAQKRIQTIPFTSSYRTNSLTFENKELYSVHGMLIYQIDMNCHAMGGVMVKSCPDPVINFSRGAQLIPGIFCQ
ncbi:MAG: hypothetical protein ACRY3E_03455 [Candidatus Lariskella arthropodorum]